MIDTETSKKALDALSRAFSWLVWRAGWPARDCCAHWRARWRVVRRPSKGSPPGICTRYVTELIYNRSVYPESPPVEQVVGDRAMTEPEFRFSPEGDFLTDFSAA